MSITVSDVVNTVTVVSDGETVIVNDVGNSVIISDIGAQGAPGADGAGYTPSLEESQIIDTAQQAPISNIVRDANGISSVTYSDYKGITAHSKTLQRDGQGVLTGTTEVFTYDGETWTLTITLGRNGGGQVISKTFNIARV